MGSEGEEMDSSGRKEATLRLLLAHFVSLFLKEEIVADAIPDNLLGSYIAC